MSLVESSTPADVTMSTAFTIAVEPPPEKDAIEEDDGSSNRPAATTAQHPRYTPELLTAVSMDVLEEEEEERHHHHVPRRKSVTFDRTVGERVSRAC